MSLPGPGSSRRRSSLKEWQKQQKVQKERWKETSSQNSEMAKELHKIFQQLAIGTPTFKEAKHLDSFHSRESSTFWPHLLKTAEIVIANGFDPRQYLVAQFQFFKQYFNKIPYPSQLHTPNAIDRFVQYTANRQLRIQERENQEIAMPKQSAKVRDKERLLYWKDTIASLARPRGASDKEAAIIHCEIIPPDILMAYGVWDEVKDQVERAQPKT